MNYDLLGIHGKAGAGKDTLAKGLRLHAGFQRMAFADPLRRAAAEAFGIELEWFVDPDLKGMVHPYWGITPRQILQQMGTEAMRKTFGRDIWVRRWRKDFDVARLNTHVVVTDVREGHEADAIRNLGGLIIHIERPGAGLSGAAGMHSSEAGIPVVEGDWQIVNDGSVMDMWDRHIGPITCHLHNRKVLRGAALVGEVRNGV